MWSRQAPLDLGVAPFFAGVLLGMAASERRLPLALALAASAIAWRGRAGLALALFAAGLGTVWARGPAVDLSRELDLTRPAVLEGRLVEPWRQRAGQWSARIETRLARQGNRVLLMRQPVYISAPGGAEPPAGAYLRARGYLRRGAGFANRPQFRLGAWRLRIKSWRFASSEARDAAPWDAFTGAARARVEGALAVEPSRGEGAALARALVLGDPSRVEQRTLQGLRRYGLAHLLAVSGLHVGLLLALAMVVTRPLPGPLRWAAAALSALVYLALVGPRPALLRAAAMAMLGVAALGVERPGRAHHRLALVAAALLALRPRALHELGFQLTLAATLGIVLAGPLLASRWQALPPSLAQALAASVAAQLFSLPWALPAFRLVTPAAPVFNLLAVPWTALALAVSFGWIALELLAPAAAPPALALLDLLARPFSLLGRHRPTFWTGRPLDCGWAGAAAIALLAILVLRSRSGWVWSGGAVLLLAAALAAGPGRGRQLAMLDVGQGEAIVLRDGEEVLLVDGGGWREGDLAARVLVPALAHQGIARLRAVALSHPDVDHCGGLADLAAYVPIDELWIAPGWRRSPCAERLLALPGVAVRPLWRGQSRSLGAWRVEALHPPPGDRTRGNDRSLVLRASAAGVAVLLTGDLEAAGEGLLLARAGERLASAVLKVGHHGSATSSSASFLAAVAPRIALISAGVGNPYGHPSATVLARLRQQRIRVLRTDRDGLLVVDFGDSGSLEVELPAAPRDVAAVD